MFLSVLTVVFTKSTLEFFEISSLRFLLSFCFKNKFTFVPYSKNKSLNHTENKRSWRETEWNLGLGVLVEQIWCASDLKAFSTCQFGAIQCTYLKVPYNSKTAFHRSKQTEVWNLEILVVHIWYGVVFKDILGHPMHLLGVEPRLSKISNSYLPHTTDVKQGDKAYGPIVF